MPSPPASSPNRDLTPWLRGILLAALILRLAAVPFVHGKGYLSDEREYILMAERIISGGGFVDSNGFHSVRAPLYPLVLAGVFAVSGGSVALAHVVGCLLGALAVYLGHLLALRMWGDPKSALFAAGILAFLPSLVIYSTLLLTETLYIVLFLAAFLAAEQALREPNGISATVLGVCAGLASLTRPVFFGFVPIMFVILLRTGGRSLARPLAVAAVAWIVVLAPWTARNFVLLGEFVPVASGAGSAFLTGNNPFATGTWRVEPGFEGWFDSRAREQGVQDPGRLSETQRSRVSGRIALNYVRTEPKRTLALALRKSHIFWVYPVTQTDSDIAVQGAAVAGDVVLLGLFVLGCMDARTRAGIFRLMIAAMLFFWIAQLVLHAEARFRLPLVPLLAVVAGHGLRSLAEKEQRQLLLRGRRAKLRLATGLAGIAVVYGITTWMVFTHRL
jgi:Dolichyl-phosphate-mannose-protein mannosyltransferase